jgi:hypothetical protein
MSTTDFTHDDSTAVAGRPTRLKEYATNAMFCYLSIWLTIVATMAVTTLAGKGPLPSPMWLVNWIAHIDAIIISLLYALVGRFFRRWRLLAYYVFLVALEVLPWLIWGWGPGLHPVGVYSLIVFVLTPFPFTAAFGVVSWLFDRLADRRHRQASVTSAV